MGKRVVLIQGHPDASTKHFCHALEDAYADGLREGGHELKRIPVAELDFPLLHSQREWEEGALPAGLKEPQEAIRWAEHLVLFFPLWLGDMPALLKGFLEQVARPGFAFSSDGKNPFGHKGLSGRSARVVVTMGMPALVYRWIYRAHSLKSLERNILAFIGIQPINETLIGMMGNLDPDKARRSLQQLRQLGASAA